MKRFKKRYLVLIIGAVWWWAAPFNIFLPFQFLAAIIIYYILAFLDLSVNPVVPKNNDLAAYYAVRDSLQNGDLIAFGGTDLFAKLIRKSTASAYSHVGMIVRFDFLQNANRIFILEALTKRGVVLMPLSTKLLAYDGTAGWLPLHPGPGAPENYRQTIFEFLMQQLGKSYDYRDIQALVKKILFKFSAKFSSLENFAEDTTRMMCSELVAEALQASGLCQFANRSQLSPGDIVKLDIFSKPAIKLI